ncbi:MAG: flagellar filament capping protein FliD [Lachnospiraceae bacterium]|nr:flagellar filament capping protein FliD [Lachnospiraceae bacterium]
MSIIQRQDVSYLFSGLGSRSNTSNLFDYSLLSDYASIKSGSYSKLVKAYYSKMGNEDKTTKTDDNEKKSTSLASDTSKKLTEIKSSADDLKESGLKLMETGKESLFVEKNVTTKNEDGTETTTKSYDTDAIYKAVSDFVKDYNALVESVEESDASTVKSAADNMTNIVNMYENTLGKIGITIGDDNKLSIDEKAFKAADMDDVKDTFNGSRSFAATVSSQAEFVNSAATREATKANTYTGNGTYSNNFSSGDLFNSLF